MPFTIWDLIAQLVGPGDYGVRTPPETGPVGPFPVGMSVPVQDWLEALQERDMGVGPLAQQFPQGYGLSAPAAFPPGLPLDTSQVRDWRGARNPWTPWFGLPPAPPAYDPIGSGNGDWNIWNAPGGYPY